MSILLNNLEGPPNYTLGDQVELIFKPDTTALALMSPVVSVDILDIFDNLLFSVSASALNDIYIAEYTIPLDLGLNYNALAADITSFDARFYFLKDRWNITSVAGSGVYLEFGFTVLKQLESVDQENCIIEVFIDPITAVDGARSDKAVFAFTTKLNPYYANANNVRDINRALLSVYDNFTIARQVINMSKIVDYHMKPNKIYYQSAYDHAVANYVRIKTATTLLLSVAQINEEEKQIDTFRYKTSSAAPKDLIDPLEDAAHKFALFIWAGGKDTPFVSKPFAKGVFDPNRPQLGRANMDQRGWLPFVNTSLGSIVTEVDGNTTEIRGERGISYSYVYSKYLNTDRGDVGYLSGI
jgi:hypothetical protein